MYFRHAKSHKLLFGAVLVRLSLGVFFAIFLELLEFALQFLFLFTVKDQV